MAISTESVWENFHSRLLSFISGRVKDPAVAKDLLQEVFIKIHLKLHTVSNEEKLAAWLFQVTRNTILDYFRESKKFTTIEGDIPEITDSESFNSELLECCLMPFISRLDAKYREAILLTDIEGLSQKEYAEKANISYSGAKSRVQRARESLRSAINDCCHPVTDKYGNIVDKGTCKTDLYCGTNPASFS